MASLDIVRAGNAVRVRTNAGVALVLLVGDDATSQFWLSILPYATCAQMRYFIAEEDFLHMRSHLYILPNLLPAFLVVVNGFFVDWFPAPLTPPDQLKTPLALLTLAEEHLLLYDS